MKVNYRNQPSCPKCKFVAWGESHDYPELFCNEDNTYDAQKLHDWLWDDDDDKIEQLWVYEDSHRVHINGICDEYIEKDDDE